MHERMIAVIAPAKFKKMLDENDGRFPLLTLDEFFKDNTEEDSIAPNQWEYGRPTLAEIWNRLREIEQMPNVAWVRVALHDDTEIVRDGGDEALILVGDSIILCTDMDSGRLEKAVDCEWLCSDGVIELKQAQIETFSCMPPIPDNFKCLAIVWD